MFDEMTPYVFRIHAAVTCFLAGLIWFVQVVHYPLMRVVGTGHFREYERLHQQRTTVVVAPAMLLELAMSVAVLVIAHRSGTVVILSWISMMLLILIWASTFALQVPLHKELARGFNDTAWRGLVLTNLIRTMAWTARGVIAVVLIR